jgi:uncharacterized membrane protein
MTESDRDSLEKRIQKLEHEVATLQELVTSYFERQPQGASPQPVSSSARPRQSAPPPAAQPVPSHPPSWAAPSARPAVTRESIKQRIPSHMRSTEYWLGRVGIGLLLLGLAFLFKYAIDEGWLTPPIRVAFGVLLGLTLIVLGLRVASQQPHFSPLLLGGGIASFYITGFAAYQLFGLVPHGVAFGFMIVTTGLAWLLSIRQNQAMLSVIGVLGGLGTPFLLYTGTGTMTGLVTYTSLILGGVALIYMYRGWRTLILTAAMGSWVVFSVAYQRGILNVQESDPSRWPLQVGILIGAAIWWLIPVLRELLWARWPDRWEGPKEAPGSVLTGAENMLAPRGQVYLLSIATPVYTLLLSSELWNLPDITWGWILMGAALLYGVVAQGLRPYPVLRNLAFTQVVTAIGLGTLSLGLILSGEQLLVAWAVELAMLQAVAFRTRLRLYQGLAHVMAVVLLVWFSVRVVFESAEGTALINGQAAADLLVIIIGFMSAALMRTEKARRLYLVVSFFALAGLFAREFDGNALMLLITLQAVSFHILAMTLSDPVVRRTANFFFAIPGFMLAHRLHLDEMWRMTEPTGLLPVFNSIALTDLVVIGTGAIAARFSDNREVRLTYRLAAHLAVLVWFFREFASHPNGQAYVSVAWGVYALILLVVGLRKDWHQLRLAALATLFLVVAKLFLVDLAQLEAIWRVLLFMGFGGLFLVMSYYFRALWQSPNGSAPEPRE